MKIKKIDFIFFVSAAILIGITYGDIFRTFFLQDEWSWFPRFTYWNTLGPLPFIKPFLMGFRFNKTSQFTPLAWFGIAAATKFFGLKFSGYAALSLFLHFLNTVLVFYLTKFLTKRRDTAFLAGALFAVTSVHFDAIIFIGTSLVTLGATFFGLLSLIFYVTYLNKKKRIFFRLCLASLILALAIKTNPIYLFIFIPLDWFWLRKGIMDQQEKRKFFLFLGTAGIYSLTLLALRLTGLQNPIPGLSQIETPFLSLSAIIYQLITPPLKALSQAFVSPSHIYFLTQKWIEFAYPFLFSPELEIDRDLVSQTVGSDLISYFLMIVFLVIIGAVFSFLRKKKERVLLRALVFAVLLITTSVTPTVFLLLRGQHAISPLIRPSDLYPTSIGAVLVLSIATFSLAEKFSRKKCQSLTYSFALLVFCSFFFYHYHNLQQEVFPFGIRLADQRKGILSQIKETYPEIAAKSIFYTESDAFYYGHSEPSLPFQTGLGRCLLAWYNYSHQSHPWQFFEDDFLYSFNSNGYREIEDKGFGYFHNFDKLAPVMREYHLTPESVYAFAWKGETEELFNITDQVRQRLKNE